MSIINMLVFPSLALVRQFYDSHIKSSKPSIRDCQGKALDTCEQDKPVINISICTGSGKSRVITECISHSHSPSTNNTIEYYATDGTLPDI